MNEGKGISVVGRPRSAWPLASLRRSNIKGRVGPCILLSECTTDSSFTRSTSGSSVRSMTSIPDFVVTVDFFELPWLFLAGATAAVAELKDRAWIASLAFMSRSLSMMALSVLGRLLEGCGGLDVGALLPNQSIGRLWGSVNLTIRDWGILGESAGTSLCSCPSVGGNLG